MSVLCNNDLCRVGAVCRLGTVLLTCDVLIVLVAVEEEDDICVLLDRSRITKVCEGRTLACAGARLGATVKLGATNDGHAEILCHNLEVTGDLAHLLCSVIRVRGALHKTDIVDDHKAEVGKSSEFGLHLSGGNLRGIVDVDLRARERGDYACDIIPILGLELTCTKGVRVNKRLAGDNTGNELLA